MARFRSYGQLDDPHVEDGDPAFRGLDQNTEPTLLEAGIVQQAENVRFDQGIVRSRKGLEIASPIVGGKALVKFLDPINNREDILVVTNDKLIGVGLNGIYIGNWDRNEDTWDSASYLFNQATVVNEDLDEPYGDDDEVFGIQAFEQVLLFCKDNRPKAWTGGTNTDVNQLSETPANSSVDFACPSAPFGYYFANRLVVPYYEDSPSTTAFSDILEPNEFTNLNTFFCNKGTADKTMGYVGFTENQILVLNKESIHLINNVHALETNSTSYEVTRQYGIAGHRAYVQNGSYIYFVTSEGNIQVMVPSGDPAKGMGIAISKITLDQEALSKPITPFLETVNATYLYRSIVHYHRNKIYFCLPVGDSQYPNAIAIYDSLNSVWVSIDTFEQSWFQIRDLCSLDNDLYLLSDRKVYKYDTGTDDDGHSIISKLRTRDYMCQTRDIKKFVRSTISYGVDEGSSFNIKTHTKSPDITTISKDTFAAEDKPNNLSRFNCRQRGYSASVEIQNSGAPIKVKSVSMEAFVHAGKAAANYGK